MSRFVRVSHRMLLAAVLICCLSMSVAAPIAGVKPDQRPEGAPVIEWVQHDKAWYRHALTGIQPPYPRSLYFLDNQGDWYTPFNHPGMRGYYDIRQWGH